MSTDSTFTTETLTQELKKVWQWGLVAHWIGACDDFYIPKSVTDTIVSLKNAEKQGSFLIAHLVDNHPIYGWKDVIRGVEYVHSDIYAQLNRKYGGGMYELMSDTQLFLFFFSFHI